MPILQRVRKLLRRRPARPAPPGPLAFEDIPIEAPPADTAQATCQDDAMLAVEPDHMADAALIEDAGATTSSDLEIEPASHILADMSHYARLEPKTIPSDGVVTPEEFSRTTDLLTEGMHQLRAQLVLQAGRLDSIAHSIERLGDAVSADRGPDSRIEPLEQAVVSMLGRQDEAATAIDGLKTHMSASADAMRARQDELGRTIDGLTTRMINVQKHQLAHVEQLKAQEGAVQQSSQRILSLEHAQRTAIGSLEHAIERMARETANLERRTSTLRGVALLAAVAATTGALLGLIALIGG